MANPLAPDRGNYTGNPLDPYDRWNVRPLYMGPVGTSQVGGDTALTMPSPDVSPVVGWYGQHPVTAATRSNALDIASTLSQFGPADVGAISPVMRSPFKLNTEMMNLPPHLTDAERKAVSQYASNSMWVNGAAPEAEATRKALDAAIDKSELGGSATLYRGFGASPELVKALKVGNVVPLSSGHVSTSLSRDAAQGFADDLYSRDETSVLVRIDTPSGTKALAVPTAPELMRDPDNPVNQQELLLPRGMRFRITDRKEPREGQLELRVTPEQ